MEANTIENTQLQSLKTMTWEEIQALYPDEWILVGNPGERKDIWDITSGIPLHHSPDERTLFIEGRDVLKKFNPETHTVVFTGKSKFPKYFMTGIFGRVK